MDEMRFHTSLAEALGWRNVRVVSDTLHGDPPCRPGDPCVLWLRSPALPPIEFMLKQVRDDRGELWEKLRIELAAKEKSCPKPPSST